MESLRYLSSGEIFIEPKDDCDRVVDVMLETSYSEEFCIARDFDDIDFMARLMEAGFLVMSTEINLDDFSGDKDKRYYLLLPKLHLIRSALFFPNLHIKKRIAPLLSRYELKIDTCFDQVLDKCVEKHGSAWLTLPLVCVLKELRRTSLPPRPVSFELYRDGKLMAGEVGIVLGRVYTSYSGYCEENNSGTIQMILMAKWLEKNGFEFLDFGMPLKYKSLLGAHNISPEHFVRIFRAARR